MASGTVIEMGVAGGTLTRVADTAEGSGAATASGGAVEAAEGKPAGARVRLPFDPAGLTPAGRRDALFHPVRDIAAQVLGFPEPGALDPRKPLNELGLDSLMALSLTRALAGLIGRPVQPVVIFNHPTVQALVDHLAELLAPAEGGTPAGGTGGASLGMGGYTRSGRRCARSGRRRGRTGGAFGERAGPAIGGGPRCPGGRRARTPS